MSTHSVSRHLLNLGSAKPLFASRRSRSGAGLRSSVAPLPILLPVLTEIVETIPDARRKSSGANSLHVLENPLQVRAGENRSLVASRAPGPVALSSDRTRRRFDPCACPARRWRGTTAFRYGNARPPWSRAVGHADGCQIGRSQAPTFSAPAIDSFTRGDLERIVFHPARARQI